MTNLNIVKLFLSNFRFRLNLNNDGNVATARTSKKRTFQMPVTLSLDVRF